MRTTLRHRGAVLLIPILATIFAFAPTIASANTGDPLILGTNNQAGTETGVNSSAIYGLSVSAQNTGVRGDGAFIGVDGTGDTNGVRGVTQSASTSGNGVWGLNAGAGNGVFGQASNSDASGVYGQNGGSGYGVAGRASQGVGVLGDSSNGVGVWANSNSALALRVTGTASFSRSGLAIVKAGTTDAVVPGVDLNGFSLVLATLQDVNGNVALKAAVPIPAYKAILLRLTAAPTVNVRVAWFVLN